LRRGAERVSPGTEMITKKFSLSHMDGGVGSKQAAGDGVPLGRV